MTAEECRLRSRDLPASSPHSQANVQSGQNSGQACTAHDTEVGDRAPSCPRSLPDAKVLETRPASRRKYFRSARRRAAIARKLREVIQRAGGGEIASKSELRVASSSQESMIDQFPVLALEIGHSDMRKPLQARTENRFSAVARA